MSAPDLKEALRLVDVLGLAPLARVYQARPKSMAGRLWQQWADRREEAEAKVAEDLTAAGASVQREWLNASISFCGHMGASNMGLLTALKHWKKAAELALSGRSTRKERYRG